MAIGRAALWRFGLVALMAALLSCCADRSLAVTTTYTGTWAGGTIWSSDAVILNNGARVTGNVTVYGLLQFNQSGTSLTVSSTISGTGRLSLTNTGTLNLTGVAVASNSLALDMTVSASAGVLQVRSGTGVLRIGQGGTGALNVAGGSIVNSDGYLGHSSNRVGSATISSGTWANSGRLFVGFSGTGTLNVTGGRVSNTDAYLGFDNNPNVVDTGVGSATVSGGTWANSGSLYVGQTGDGTLIINGGAVSNTDGYISYDTPLRSYGTATVSRGSWTNSGNLFVGRVGQGTLNLSGGTITNVHGYIGILGYGDGTVNVSSGTWTNSGDLHVGQNGNGTLNLSGGAISSVNGYISNHVSSPYYTSTGTALVSGGAWSNSGDLFIGRGNPMMSQYGDGKLSMFGGRVSNRDGYLGDYGGFGTATISGGTWANSRWLAIGYGMVGTLNVTGGSVSNEYCDLGYVAYVAGTASVSSGSWATKTYLNIGTGGRGTLQISGGSVSSAETSLGVDATGSGSATVTGGAWTTSGNFFVGRSGTGTLIVSGGTLTVGGTLSAGAYGTITVNPAGTLQIGTGGTNGWLTANLTNNGSIVFNRSGTSAYSGVISGTGTIRNSGAGTTTLTGQTSFTSGLGVTSGYLIAGSTASVNGFSSTGILSAASGGTLELQSKGLAYVNGLATLSGGTIRAANGVSLGAAANVTGSGVLSGAVSASTGSRIEAEGGKMSLGDALSFDGFVSNGVLYTNANEVELFDRNFAVLGSTTQLGNGTSGGSLRAANGMLLEQGKNLVGRGMVYGNFVNQGDVYGDGSTAGQQLVFAAGSTVSGNGSFTNALFNGTYAPGNSPAITNLTDGGFANTSTLLIEIGGTQAGTQYDRVRNAGTLSLLGGILNVVLTNSFMPAPGDSFEILGYGQLAGDFGTLNLPVFDNGLGWQRVTTGTSMKLVATRLPVSIDVASGSQTLASFGYSSLTYAASLSKTGAGTLNLTGTSLGVNTVVLNLVTTASAGLLQVRSGTGALTVGSSSIGTLNISGGSVTNTDGTLGVNDGGVGTATVSSGTWANSGNLSVGLFGTSTGTLNITGGSVTNGGGYLGGNVGSVGVASVSSGTWANSSFLSVGNGGTGTLNVTGGSVTSAIGYLGTFAGSVGTATVSSGTWTNSGDLFVGRDGKGVLNITGGNVTNGNSYLGANAGSVGTATVSSGTWANSGNLTVGVSDTGALTMTGGLVIVASTLTKGSAGTINLNPGGTLQIGTGGTTGVMGTNLTNNGTLIFDRSNASTYSGVLSGSGSLMKRGSGTLTLSGSNLFTGRAFIQQGVLAITNTAAISSSPLVSLASGASFDVSGLSSGYTVPSGQTIAGAGTVWGSVTFGRGSTLSPGSFSAASGASMLAADMQAGSLQALVVPEPATLGMVGVGLGFLGLGALRRKRVA